MRNFLLFFFLTPILLLAQETFQFSHYNREDGLSDNFITSITEDEKGFIWISSKNGINKFNGSHFTNYLKEDSSCYSLIRNDILCSYRDRNNGIWFGSYDGTILQFSPKQNQFLDYSLELKIGDSYPHIYNFFETDSAFFASTSRGTFRFSDANGVFYEVFGHIPSLIHKQICAFFIDSNAHYWIGTDDDGIIKMSEKTNNLETLLFYPQKADQPRIEDIIQIADSLFFFATSTGVFYLNTSPQSDGQILPVYNELSHSFITDFELDKENNLWIGTRSDGLWVRGKDAKLKKVKLELDDAHSNIAVNKIFSDSHNRIWVGTQGNGILCFNPQSNGVSNLSIHNGLTNKIVSSIAVDNDQNLWVGTDGGGISIFKPDLSLHKTLNTKNGLPSDLILNLVNTDNTMWVSTWYGGFLGINTLNYNVSVYNTENSGLSCNGIKSSCAYGNDTILIGTHEKGLCSFSISKNSIDSDFGIEYPIDFSNVNDFINQVLVDKYKNIWVASIRNLYTVKDNKAIEILSNDSTFSPHLPLFVFCIAEDPEGYILAGTKNTLYRINSQTYEIENISAKIPELKNAKVLSTFVNSKRQYWIATTKGLYTINPENYKYQKIVLNKYSDGLFFTPRAVYEDKLGKMYFGTNEGLYSFYPEDLNWKSSIADLYFSNLFLSYNKVNTGSELLPRNIAYTDTIFIPRNHSIWGISFSSVCFNSPESVEYAYMLEGFDKTWNEIGNKQDIAFTNIPNGTYKLKVRAWQYNPQNTITKELIVVIAPSWWKTKWFKIGIGVFIVIIIYLMYLIRLKSLEKQKRILAAEVKEKIKELSEQKQFIEKQNSVLLQFSAKQEKTNNLLRNQKLELEKLSKKLQHESTELSKVNNTLKLVNETKEQLFSIITHDVRNSFMSIQSISDKLLKEIITNANSKLHNQLTYISKAVVNTSDLLSNLLYWSKTQTTSIECNPEHCDVETMVRGVIKTYSHVALDKKISVNYSNINASEIYADKEMIITVLRNIINNALKFSPPGGFVLISTKTQNNTVEFQIKDSGKGIDKSIISTLFATSQPAAHKNLKTTSGSGLGLIISQQFVEKNNGTMRVQTSKNNGTTFIIQIPINNENEHEKPAGSLHDSLYKIAIVEDNRIILDLLDAYLGTKHSCLLFSNGTELLEFLKTEKVHLIISDIFMGEIDGLSLCKEVKSNKRTADIPVILISSNHEDNIKENAYNVGADAFIEKPISKQVLLALVNKLLSFPKQKVYNLLEVSESNHADFLQRFDEILNNNIANAKYSVDDMAKDLLISRSQLFRKVKEHHSISPKDYFIKIRMQAAAELMKLNDAKIVDIAFSTGFSDPSYFSRCFTKHFGVNPSSYKSMIKEDQ